LSARTEQLKREATAAREQLVGTVGDLGGAVTDAKEEAVATARRYAPYAAGAVGALTLLRVVLRRKR
jgi:hypothetical protein